MIEYKLELNSLCLHLLETKEDVENVLCAFWRDEKVVCLSVAIEMRVSSNTQNNFVQYLKENSLLRLI